MGSFPATNSGLLVAGNRVWEPNKVVRPAGDYCLNSFPVSLPPGPENAQCVFAMLSSSVFLLSCMVITILILLVFTVLYLPLKLKTSDFELKLVKL